MALEHRESILLLSSWCLLVVHLALSFRRVDFRKSLKSARSLAAAWGHRLGNLFRGGSRVAEGDTLMSKAVTKEVARQLEEKALRSVTQWMHCVAIMLMSICYNMLTETPRYMSFEQDVNLVLSMVAALTLQSLPALIFPRHVWAWYCIFMVLSVFYIIFTGKDTIAIFMTYCTMIVARLFAAWAYQKSLLVFVMNSACTVAWLYRLTSNVVPEDEGLRRLGTSLLTLEMVFVIIVTLFARASFQSTLAQARHTVVAANMSGEMSAMTEMLNLVCDVTVELDGQLQVIDSAPKLAAMLTLSPDSGARGMRLQNFMPSSADQMRFEEQLTTSANDKDSCTPGALHIGLRDSLNNRLDVEVFYVHFRGLDDRMRFRVGIREFTDNPVAELKKFPRKTNSRRQHSSRSGARRGTPTDSPSGSIAASDEEDAPIRWPAGGTAVDGAPIQWPAGAMARPSSSKTSSSSATPPSFKAAADPPQAAPAPAPAPAPGPGPQVHGRPHSTSL